MTSAHAAIQGALRARTSRPLSMGEAAVLVGFTRNGAQRMRRYLLAREARDGAAIATRTGDVRARLRVTEAQLRHHCPELFSRHDEGVALLTESQKIVQETIQSLKRELRSVAARVRVLESRGT